MLQIASKPIKTESRLVVARGCGKGQWQMIANGYRVSLRGDGNIFKLIVVMVTPENILKSTELDILIG